MEMSLKKKVSVNEAIQNFAEVMKQADKEGAVIISDNNSAKYILMNYSEPNDNVSDETVKALSQRFIMQNKSAYEELAKWKRFHWGRFFYYMKTL